MHYPSGEKITCEALQSISSIFPNKFNKFNNTGIYLSLIYDTKIAYTSRISHKNVKNSLAEQFNIPVNNYGQLT